MTTTTVESTDAFINGPHYRRWVAAAAVFGNIVLTYWSRVQPFNGQSMGYVSGKYHTLLTPAGYAFSIWGIIFLALAVYAVWQLQPKQRYKKLPDAVAQPLTVASLATAAWVVLFAYEHLAWCAVTMLVILMALIMAYGRARRLVLARQAPRWSSLPFALYLGWISVATVVNITLALWALGWQPATNVSILLALLLVLVISGLSLVLDKSFREVTFSLVTAWALVAVWVAHRTSYPELGWGALCAAIGIVVASAVMRRFASSNNTLTKETLLPV